MLVLLIQLNIVKMVLILQSYPTLSYFYLTLISFILSLLGFPELFWFIVGYSWTLEAADAPS